MKLVVLLSGPIAVGKSEFCAELRRRSGAMVLSTRQILLQSGAQNERAALIKRGEELDEQTKGKWVADGVEHAIRHSGPDALIVDCVRTSEQVRHVRAMALHHQIRIHHVHLVANYATLRERYLERDSQVREFEDYRPAWESSIEAKVRELRSLADIVVPTDSSSSASQVARAMAGCGIFPSDPERTVDVIVGAQYGSEGKGNICAHLAPEYDILMRVGGPNAGHKVAYPPYKYVQLPSGTGSNPRARILIGAGATIWLPQMLKEIKDQGLSGERLFVDPQAMMIEQADRDEETGPLSGIGSTKQGVGIATARKIVGRDGQAHYGSKVRLAKDIAELNDFTKVPVNEKLEEAYARSLRIMLEGTQGTSLSLHHGSWPHVTSRETTASGCLADAGIAPTRARRIVMVTRTYPIRVGGVSGPMEGEISYEAVAQRSGLDVADIRTTEVGSVSGVPRRVGEFEWEQVRRAAALNGATDVALTFADYLNSENRAAYRYEQLSTETKDFIADVERVTNAPVSLISTRFSERAVIDRRTWR